MIVAKYHTENDSWLLIFCPSYLERGNYSFAYKFENNNFMELPSKNIFRL